MPSPLGPRRPPPRYTAAGVAVSRRCMMKSRMFKRLGLATADRSRDACFPRPVLHQVRPASRVTSLTSGGSR